MHIAIDARMMSAGVSRGIGRYTEELIRGMLAVSSNERYTLFVKDVTQSPFLNNPRVDHIQAAVPWYGWREQLQFPKILNDLKPDLYHFPHWNVPLAFNRPFVVTIHDLILLHPASASSTNISTRHPLYAKLKRLAYRVTLHRVAAKAKSIIVPTNFVAKDVERFFPQTKPQVTSEGLTRFSSPDKSVAGIKPFLFYVGSAYPHKRLDILVTTWPEIKHRHPELKLYIAGRLDAFMQRVQAQVEERKLVDIVFLDHITDEQLAAYLRSASAFIFPSSDEGFGLPPIEALSLGCPVVSSDASCLPEVLPKEGVVFFRNGDADDMIRAIDQVLTDDMKQQALHGADLIAEGFSWEQVARRTLDVYRHALNQ